MLGLRHYGGPLGLYERPRAEQIMVLGYYRAQASPDRRRGGLRRPSGRDRRGPAPVFVEVIGGRRRVMRQDGTWHE